jgi:hypothetical protein
MRENSEVTWNWMKEELSDGYVYIASPSTLSTRLLHGNFKIQQRAK